MNNTENQNGIHSHLRLKSAGPPSHSARIQIVIDTDMYAGNFEREMVAYITGIVGSCDIGERYAEIAFEELSEEYLKWMESNICHIPDSKGCIRPSFIAETPSWGPDGYGKYIRTEEPSYPSHLSVGFEMKKWPSLFIASEVLSRAKVFASIHNAPIVITGLRFVELVTTSRTSKFA